MHELGCSCTNTDAVRGRWIPYFVRLTNDSNLENVSDRVYRMSIKDLTNPRSGGKISVNGMTIEIPDNLLIGFPATFVPFAEVAAAFPNFGGDDGPSEVSVCLYRSF